MAMLTLRYDLRHPPFAETPLSAAYAACLDQCAWGEEHGFTAVVVSEHHATDDGYLPSPLVVASAMAARTNHIAITVAALLVPLYDPVKLAEDIAVLDLVSRGRVSYVAGLGYRPAEYESLGRPFAERAREQGFDGSRHDAAHRFADDVGVGRARDVPNENALPCAVDDVDRGARRVREIEKRATERRVCAVSARAPDHRAGLDPRDDRHFEIHRLTENDVAQDGL